MQMPNWLDKRAFLTPDRLAVQFEGEQITFAQLRQHALETARKISSLHDKQGDMIALLCFNHSYTVELIHAVHYANHSLMPLNIRLTAHELQYQLADAACTFLIYDDAFSDVVMGIMGLYPQLQAVSVSTLQQMKLVEEESQTLRHSIDLDDIHTIMYTSGTTGFPKGVIQRFGNHWNSAIGSVLNLGLTEHDKWLVCVPLFHISGLSIVIRSVLYGIPIVLQQKFQPDAVNKAINEHGVTIMSVVSNMLGRMLEHLGDEQYPASLRCMLLGGGPAPLPLLEACSAKNIPVFQTYGMTETCSQIVTLQPEYMFSKLGSAGKPLFQSELRIVQDGRDVAPNQSGEIIVRGPNVTSGYLNGVGSDSFVDGWLYTGDVGYLDEEGFLYVLDRRKDMLISGGENIYPAEIEATLISHPLVLEAGVTGLQSQQWGQVPIAFVVLKHDALVSESELLAYCTERLAKYKVPQHIFVVEQLPRNASNKLLRRELLQLLPDSMK